MTEETALLDLRAEIARLRQELTRTTEQYRRAVAQHDSQQAIPLLRSRSRLMRRLLDTQCELLLSFRAEEHPLPRTERGELSGLPHEAEARLAVAS